MMLEICCVCFKTSRSCIDISKKGRIVDKIYLDKLKFIFPDLFQNEDEPFEKICDKCCDLLDNVYSFKQLCINSMKKKEDIKSLVEHKTEAPSPKFEIIPEIKEELDEEEKQSDNEAELKVQVPSLDTFGLSPDITGMEQDSEEEDTELPCIPCIDEQALKEVLERKRVKVEETDKFVADHMKQFFGCKECKKQFSSYQTLRTHLRRHTGNKRYRCRYCDKQYYTISERITHELVHTNNFTHTCPICNKGFKEKYRLTKHMDCHDKIPKHLCDICGKAYIHQSSLFIHKFSHSEERTHQCDLCDKSFKNAYILANHKKTHEDTSYKCNQCDKDFKTQSGLHKHMKFHSKDDIHKCEICDKIFYYKSAVKRHIKKSHVGTEPVQCDVCFRMFSCTGTLKVHLLTHTGEKPFSCTVCEKPFRQKATLLVHMRLHTGERPFKCNICEKGFIKSHHLAHHMKQHGEK